MYARLVTALAWTTGCRPAERPCWPAPPATSSSAGTSIPDNIPILGGLDDLVVVVLAVDLFIDGAPEDLLREKLDELGIPRSDSSAISPRSGA